MSIVGVQAQNEEDALRYSMTYFGGTARGMAMAGSFSAIGGDYSAVISNPAALGRFKRSNFSLTQNLERMTTVSDFYGQQNYRQGYEYNLSNFSYVKAYELDPNKYNGWYGIQIGIGMNRIKSFNDRFQYAGQADSSILHSFINEANGTHPDNIYDAHPFTAGLAYDTYAIDPAANNTYTTDFTSGTAYHERVVKRRGGITELNLLTLSGNYKNKFLIGGSVNILFSKYEENFTHRETYSNDSLWIQNINYTGDLNIRGTGANVKAGFIFLPTEWLRFGMGVQSRTYYRMNDTWSNNMTTSTDDGLKYVNPEFVPYGEYDYKIKTPFRANASLGLVFKKLGSIAAEVEYVDYSRSFLSDRKFSPSPYSFNAENAQIDNIYRNVLNYKLGIEARVTEQFYLRAGYAYYDSPYSEEKEISQQPVQFYTAGFGYNFGAVYLDAAMVMQKRIEDYYAYDPTVNGSRSTLDFENTRFALTLGYRIK